MMFEKERACLDKLLNDEEKSNAIKVLLQAGFAANNTNNYNAHQL